MYIASLSLESQTFEYSYSASIFVGIKPVSFGAGSRYAETKWVWTTSAEWEFSKDTEFWEVQLPLLSTLLDHAELTDADSFSLCVQIGSPPTSKPSFTLPEQQVVPRSMINGMAGLVDSVTGDVRFVCLEHTSVPLSPLHEAGDDLIAKRLQTVSRKRVLYAHSEVLKARGEYFADLLMGGFSESDIARRSEGRCTTILVDDAGFETVYWMLRSVLLKLPMSNLDGLSRFIYTNELSFADQDDARLVMDQLHIDRSEIAKMLSGAPAYLGLAEWDYCRLPMDGDLPEGGVSELDYDSRTIKSVSSTGTSVSRRVSTTNISPTLPSSEKEIKQNHQARARSASSAGSTISKTSTVSTTSSVSKPTSRGSVNTSSSATPTRSRIAGDTAGLKLTTNPPGASRTAPSKSSDAAISQTSPNSLVLSHYPLPRLHSEPDPHQHPMAIPARASALSMYMLSHRYRLETLESLAKEHILTRMTSENCMPML